MRVTIVAIGRLKDGAERVLVDRYLKRMASSKGQGLGPMAELETAESRRASVSGRQQDEAARLIKLAGAADLVVLLDERGKALSSSEFAAFLGNARDDGRRDAAFLIGGPDGHGAAARAAAHVALSLGPMTLPHGLARAVLAEQLYRASAILAGHPYHRA